LTGVQGHIHVISGRSGELCLVIQGDAVPFSSFDGGLGERFLGVTVTLAAVRKKVVSENGHYGISGAATHNGNPLTSVSKDLVEGIAFEKTLRRSLNARDFGLYSAFCTHMDFPCALHKQNCIKELLDRHFECYGQEFPDNGLVEAAQEVQSRLFPFPIWGPGIVTDSAQAIEFRNDSSS
jgi:hypothetical protein